MAQENILDILNKAPAGLTIAQISKKSGYHRNTLGPKLDELLKKGEVKVKTVGKAKIYYSPEHNGLHSGVTTKKGKNIRVGMGTSKLETPLEAAVQAAKRAVHELGENPTFSIVMFSSHYDPSLINRGICQILGTDNWIGCSTDREINSETGYNANSVQVLSIASKYLHFNIAVAEDYRDNPREKAKIAITAAMAGIKSDRVVDPYVQYARHTKKSYIDIVKSPPYFILTFIGGTYYDDNGQPAPGQGLEFIEGIFEAVGPNIPVLGAEAASDIEELMKGKGKNYILAGGKVYSKAAIVAFVVSDLYFSYGLAHGFKPTKKLVSLTKVTGNNRIAEELNEKPAVPEYCSLVGATKEDFLKNPWAYTLIHPLAILDIDGKEYIKTTGATPDGNSLYALSKLIEDTSAKLMCYDEQGAIDAMSVTISQAEEGYDDKKIAFALIFSCCGRRVLLGEKEATALEKIKQDHGQFPMFGFNSFGEIGARRNKPTQYNNLTVASLVVFDNLLTE